MLTTTAAWTGWKINSLLRRKLKLSNYGLGSTQLAMALAPALFVGSCHLFVSLIIIIKIPIINI